MKALIKQIESYNPKADFELIKKAWDFAHTAHKGQKRLSGDPFVTHPIEVAKILAHWQLDTTTIIAGLLHDTVEDSNATHEDVEKIFGEEIATLVSGVTKISSVRLQSNINEVFIEGLRKMILIMAKDLRVVFVKLADRIHNMRTLAPLPKEKQIKNAKETIEVYAPLAERLGIREAKAILENLSFPYVYPSKYKKTKKESTKHLKDADKLLNKVTRRLKVNIKNAKIMSNVTGRTKNLYSLWRKLERPNINWDFNRINDLVAIRVIVDSVEDCYQVLGIIHSTFKPVPHIGISDFIAQPKPNGYQSIHTKVFANGNIVEAQIRTQAMHEQAEHGFAAHWSYTEAKTKGAKDEMLEKGISTEENKLKWIKELIKWQKEIVDSEEFLDSVKFDAFQHRNFVFSPTGDVYDLPRYATPVDYAYAVHTDLGKYIKGAMVNNKIVPLKHILVSGDVVEILKNKSPKNPNRGWLEFVVTTLARREIAKELRKTA